MVSRGDATEANKAIVRDFFQQAFGERKPDLAARFVSRSFRQHDPRHADGRDAYIGALSELVGTFPFLQVDVKRIVAEDDLVFVHSHVVHEPGDLGTAVAEVLRLEGGKIVERWDVVQDVPAKGANRNTMF